MADGATPVAAGEVAPVIIGGGPSGLTAAYELVKLGYEPVVLEALALVGGIARTESYKGYHFDMGGHRFFTKSEEVNRFWHEVMQDDFLLRPRLSRIYYNDKFFNYPLKPLNALTGLGPVNAVLILASYIRWQLFPYREEETFEQWVTNRFGKRLFQTFFETYTEKVWGIPCSELKAEWAAQRIKDLSLKSAIVSTFLKPGDSIKTLIEEFHYPRRGPGMLWNVVKERVETRGGEVRLESPVVKVNRTGRHVDSVVVERDGEEQLIEGTHFISSMALSDFIKQLDPPAPKEVLDAAYALNYRDFLTVCLMVDREELFPDNWIYIHDPTVKVGRIQNFKNWSPEMVPDPSKTSLGLEYFCNEGDELWTTPDEELVALARAEVGKIGLADPAEVEDGVVVRVPKSYPVYDDAYAEGLALIREYVESFDNFQTIGRNGLHRYNNQDHAMLTGMLAVRNLVYGEDNDLWSVNADQEYHEEIRGDEAGASVSDAVQEALDRVFRKIDPASLGIATGLVSGLVLFLVTLLVMFNPEIGGVDGMRLGLLGQYFPGYDPTPSRGWLGLPYGFIVGYFAGYAFAFLRNAAVLLYMAILQRRLGLHLLPRILDF